MKQLFILFLALLEFTTIPQASANTYTIEGQVELAILSVPLPNHPVTIYQSSVDSIVTLATDPSGLFSHTLNSLADSALTFTIETVDICSGETLRKHIKVAPNMIKSVHFTMCAVDRFPCNAAFESIPLSPLTLHFIDNSFQTEPISWLWDFGDGQTSTESAPEHTYDTAGVYIVSLTIKTQDGCMAKDSQRIWVGDKYPCDCPEYYLPVCAINAFGQVDTFDNPCFAYCAGYAYLVSCQDTCGCKDTIAPVCVWGFVDQFTFKNACEAACYGYPDVDNCTDTTCICPEIYDPVCVKTPDGDYIEFSNACYAECAGFTAFEPCKDPCACERIYDPVCVIGSAGHSLTFDNACLAECAGYTDYFRCDTLCNCPLFYDPVCYTDSNGVTITFTNVCVAKCQGYEEIHPCDSLCICPEIYDPVCVIGEDGLLIQFSNSCFAQCAGYLDFFQCDTTCICDDQYEPVCVLLPSGELQIFDNACQAKCKGYGDYMICDTLCGCTLEYDPVCVVSDAGEIKHFPNACWAECRGYEEFVACDDCFCPLYFAPVCVLQDDGTHKQFDNPCLARCAGYTDFVPCIADCDCDGIYDPVCVILDDGSIHEYQSACLAICDGFNVFYNCNILCDCPTDEYDPVCVTLADGSTRQFVSACWAQCIGFNDFDSCQAVDPQDSTDPEDLGLQPIHQRMQLQAYPNPFLEHLLLDGVSISSTQVEIALYDILGRSVFQRTYDVSGGTWTINIPTTELSAGAYILLANDGLEKRSIKVMKN